MIAAAAGMMGLFPSCTFIGNIIKTPIRAITENEQTLPSDTPAPAAGEKTETVATRIYGR